MKILALDLGKRETVTCTYDSQSHEHQFARVATTPASIHDLLVAASPGQLLIEIGSQAGWVCDLARALEVPVAVANTNDERWKWRKTRRKTDRDDALKLVRLWVLDMLPTVYVPEAKTRQWRRLITFRQSLVARVTSVKNSIRAILDGQGLTLPGGKSGWTLDALGYLARLARPLVEAQGEDLWRGQLDVELNQLDDALCALEQVEAKLDALAQDDARVAQLQSIPGVGKRLSETLVAIIDDPSRFTNAKEVGCYAGLTPRQFQSGDSNRQGRISGAGNKLLRALLVEVSWLARQYNPWLSEVFDRVCRGSKSRRKIAIVACARRLLVRAWAMLRDGRTWQPPESAHAVAGVT